MIFKFIVFVLGGIAITLLVILIQFIFHISDWNAAIPCGWFLHMYFNFLEENWEND